MSDNTEKRPTIEGKDNVSFTFDYAGIDNSRFDPDKKPAELRNGDFKLDDSVIKGAMEAAKELRKIYQDAGIKIEQSAEFADAAKLDGKAGLTDQEIAATMLAKSMGRPMQRRTNEPVSTFNNRLSFEQLLGKDEANPSVITDPKVLAEMARQIIGDNQMIQGGVDTTTPEGNKPYFDALSNSSKGGVMRLR